MQKEYSKSGELIFEGELNGKRNGKGKEYSNQKLIFEDEYLNGHKLKGKEFINGKLEYEGMYLFDKIMDKEIYD